jgi:hypothetical protein
MGVTVFAGMLLGKRLELLPSWFPKRPSLEIPVNPDAADAEPEIGEVTAAAQTLGRWIQVLSASGDAAIETVFAGPLGRGIGSGDELRSHLAGGAPCSLVERVEVLPHGAPTVASSCQLVWVCTGDGPLLIGVGWDQAGIHRKAFAANQPFLNTAAHHDLEDMTERIAIPEAAVARERHRHCGGG